MKAVGLIAEYNPFHNGHLYHLQLAKKITHADAVVVVMSGDFTQRGEPTVLDKWQRTRMALANGADLVVELPLVHAVQPADRFAKGALVILHDLGVSDLVFGAEHPDWDFPQLVEAEKKFQQAAFQNYDQTYATQFNQQLEATTGHSLRDPNDILAFSYYKEVLQAGWSMCLHPIKRRGSDYHDLQITGQIASASAIRAALEAGKTEQAKSAVPSASWPCLQDLHDLPSVERLFPILRNHLIQAPVEELAQTYSMAEGLENRLKQAADQSLDFTTLMKKAKTKRYTYAHLLRLFLYLDLEASQKQVEWTMQHPYIRLLGFNKKGQAYLHQVKKKLSLPLITKVDQTLHHGLLDLDFRAGKLYQNFTKDEQDLKRAPIMDLSSKDR
ncbi:nucleotidyltransferase [Limosilactobacillus secaliphilus]|uniref:tRNA(Met) cytidine acetate ligase n=1 Tax=Limosilactobacillus secaliphilus TaxID=396268 RepID=A0A0R2I1X8_9LACO|nr:nucleotidyltransferase [Limosilactobacillus secaliphilus]KRN59153.1 hypothetical protein IV45_GL000191 [Limosilactobacillus secaliphilus]